MEADLHTLRKLAGPLSIASYVASLPENQTQAWLSSLTESQCTALLHNWDFLARPKQLPPSGTWSFWLVLAGRGFGKTLTGAQWAIRKAREMPGSHGALVAATSKDARKTMLSADSRHVADMPGILAISPPDFIPKYEPSNRQLTWPNGTIGTLYTAEEPDRLRGPQHHWGWVDEVATWAGQQDAWDQLMFGMRLGDHPQTCITTTPRPIPLLKQLIKHKRAVTTRGSTFENRGNLAPSFLEHLVSQYQGTRLGRQELYAEILDDVVGALWTREMIDKARQTTAPREWWKIVVGVDPAVSVSEKSAETGIVVDGADMQGNGWCLADLSGKFTPVEWATRAVNAFWHYQADCIVCEVNNGGDMVASTIAQVDGRVPVETVHATRGKMTRAHPISALYEQGRFFHLHIEDEDRISSLDTLEDQLCSYAPDSMQASPDRMDAHVWAAWKLFVQHSDYVVTEVSSPYVINRW